MGTHICARPGGICRNSEGGHGCIGCEDGFTGSGIVCNNIDECSSSDLNDCHTSGSMCIDKVGSYRCICKAGWSGSGPGLEKKIPEFLKPTTSAHLSLLLH